MTLATPSPSPSTPRAAAGQGLIGEREFLALPKAQGKQELIYGKVITMPPPGFSHGKRQSKMARLLGDWSAGRGAGEVVTEVGFVLARNPDLVRLPDVAFIVNDRLPAADDQEDLVDGPPDLAIEIMSPGDTNAELDAKVDEYLAHGVRLVWVLNPRRRTMNVYERGVPPRVLGEKDAVDGGAVLPGFSCTVAEMLD